MENRIKYTGKFAKRIALFAMTAMTAMLVACTGKDEVRWGDEASGTLALKLNITVNANALNNTTTTTTKAQNTDNYIVMVLKAGTTEVAKDINGKSVVYTCATVPEIVTLPVGFYNVVSYSQELTHADWEMPYYYGLSDQFEIKESALTNVTNIECKLCNVKVSIKYGETFLAEMADWTVTVTNGYGFKDFAKDETRCAYFSVAPLTVTMKGVRHDGEQVESSRPPKTYNDVKGGEHREITIEAELTDETTGTVGANLSVDLKTKVVDVNYNVLVTEEEIEEPGPGPGSGEGVTIAGQGFDIAQPIGYSAAAGTAVKVDIAAENGIHDLWVELDSPFLTDEFLGEIGIPKKFNLADLTTELKQIFVELGLIDNSPIRGSVAMVFDITTFTALLPAGTHNFHLEVSDEAGNAATASLVLKPY